jgi:hypothetical protein
MKKVPFVFKNVVRKAYFNLLKEFARKEGLGVDFDHYKEDILIYTHYLGPSIVVTIIDSHSSWGEPDDLTNENTPRGLNGRTYDGLKIIIKYPMFKHKIEKFVDNMKRSLEEDVVVVEDAFDYKIRLEDYEKKG